MEESIKDPGMTRSICAAEGAEPKKSSLEESISRTFELQEKDWTQYSPLTLAYIGDCVYDLVVRTVLVKRANKPTDLLHRETAQVVRAVAQSEAARRLMDAFTPQEMAVYRRGKNARPHTTAKHATKKEYLQAPGLEAVLGYLYLDGQYERVVQLVKMAAGSAL